MEKVDLERAMKLSVAEGALATMMGTLISGVFLTGFALSLGASRLQIGILAALPVLANFAQLAGSWLIERHTEPKFLCVRSLTLSRLLWLPVLLVPLLLTGPKTEAGVWWVVLAIAISSILASLGGIAWLTWIKDLIPVSRRISFFGRRNLVNTSLSLAGGMLSALYLDWSRIGNPDSLTGFIVVFMVAMACGLAGIPLMKRIPATAHKTESDERFLNLLALPLREANFRRLVMFYSCWNLAVHLAQPFFAVYMLEKLGLSFGFVTALATLSSLVGLATNNFWTRLTERFGTRPVILIATLGDALVPLWWVLLPSGATWPLVLIHCSGIFNSPLAVGPNNLMLKLSPERNASPYLAVFNAIVGPMTAVASILGGALALGFSQSSWLLGSIEMGGLKTVFLISCLGRLGSLALLLRVHEPASQPVIYVLRSIHPFAVARRRDAATLPEQTAGDRKAA